MRTCKDVGRDRIFFSFFFCNKPWVAFVFCSNLHFDCAPTQQDKIQAKSEAQDTNAKPWLQYECMYTASVKIIASSRVGEDEEPMLIFAFVR